MPRLAILAVACLALAACDSPTTPTPAARRSSNPPVAFNLGQGTRQNVSFPISGYLSNPCTGEQVNLAGTEHVVIAETDTSLTAHINTSDISGTGASTGALYHFNVTERVLSFSPSSGGFSYTAQANEEVIASGKTPNFTAHFTETFGYNGSGWYDNITGNTGTCQ